MIDRIKKNMFDFLSLLYGALPFYIRYGRQYRKMLQLLEDTEYWDREKLNQYQFEELKKIIEHAFLNVPYYKRMFNEKNLLPSDINSPDDFTKIPFLTKQIIKDNIKHLTANNMPDNRKAYLTTGGSTGIPMGFYFEKGVTNIKELAYFVNLWKRVGFKVGDKSAVIRGDVIQVTGNKFWMYDYLMKNLCFSSYHMTDQNLPFYIERIKHFQPKFIQAYPSAISIFADYLIKNNMINPFPSVRAILCGSENIYDGQRKLIEKAFGCRVFSWYGHAEKSVLAGECEYSSDLHLFPQYGYTELVDSSGNLITEEGKMGEIVCTGFNNYAMPFIRYKTMDLGYWSKGNCRCHRHYLRLKKVEGRLQELIVSQSGRLISMVAINMHSDVFDNVKQFQFYQDKKGVVVFNIVKESSYEEKDTKNIYNELKKKLGTDMKLEIKFVNDIPRTKSGKYRFLIQKIAIKNF